MRSLQSRGFAAAMFAAFVLAGSPAGAEDTLKLAIGQRGNWDTAVSELGQKAGFFKKHGLVLETLYTQGSGETLQAVISNSVDVGVAVGTPGAMSAFAKGAPVRAIASAYTGASELFWYVRGDSPIKSMADLGVADHRLILVDDPLAVGTGDVPAGEDRVDPG